MQYKRVIMLFLIGLPISILLRLFQLKYVVDTKTGFFLSETRLYGIAIMVVFFIMALVFVVFSFISHRSPEHTPSTSVPMSIASFIAALGVLSNAFMSHSALFVQTLFLNLAAILAFLFFIGFAIKHFFDFKLPDFAYLLPCIYFIFDIIKEFTVISSLSVISDNILLITALCALMVFFLQFAKLYNKVDSEYNFRKLLASGLVATYFCFVQSIPYIIFNTVSETPHTHTALSSNISLLLLGTFVCVFIASHFSKKNACIEV